MAYTIINASRYQPGEAVKGEFGQDVVNNLDDHENRISDLETVSSKIIIIDEPIIGISQYAGSTTFSITAFRAAQDMTIIAAEIYQFQAGSSGNTEIDVRKGATDGTATTIFSTKPILNFGDGNDVGDGGTISDGSVSEGEFVFLDFTQVQNGTYPVHVRIIGEPA